MNIIAKIWRENTVTIGSDCIYHVTLSFQFDVWLHCWKVLICDRFFIIYLCIIYYYIFMYSWYTFDPWQDCQGLFWVRLHNVLICVYKYIARKILWRWWQKLYKEYGSKMLHIFSTKPKRSSFCCILKVAACLTYQHSSPLQPNFPFSVQQIVTYFHNLSIIVAYIDSYWWCLKRCLWRNVFSIGRLSL